jgi:hypothetical protein
MVFLMFFLMIGILWFNLWLAVTFVPSGPTKMAGINLSDITGGIGLFQVFLSLTLSIVMLIYFAIVLKPLLTPQKPSPIG